MSRAAIVPALEMPPPDAVILDPDAQPAGRDQAGESVDDAAVERFSILDDNGGVIDGATAKIVPELVMPPVNVLTPSSRMAVLAATIVFELLMPPENTEPLKTWMPLPTAPVIVIRPELAIPPLNVETLWT